MIYRFHSACRTLRRDPMHLRLRDRAVLRILNRTQVATVTQLTVLAYGHRRLAQHRLRILWELGLLERASLPPAASRGGAPLVYRLSNASLRRLGYGRTHWRGPGYLAHSLHAVDAVCALARPDRHGPEHPVQLWLPESIIDPTMLEGCLPDAIVVLSADRGSAVLCLEIDEATQSVGPVRDKLRAYRAALRYRRGWHALFVVPTGDRLAWLREIAGRGGQDERLWVTVSAELWEAGVRVPVKRVQGDPDSRRIEDLLTDRPRRSATPVGSPRWLEQLGSGGAEEVAELLG